MMCQSWSGSLLCENISQIYWLIWIIIWNLVNYFEYEIEKGEKKVYGIQFLWLGKCLGTAGL